MNRFSSVGVFDSGIGGISVLREIHALLPDESLLYIADSKYAPYGDKGVDFIVQRSMACTEFLVSRGAKAIVMACNTATAAAVTALRACYAIPIIAMEPAVKPAVLASRNGRIGVLATAGTLKSEKFDVLVKQYADQVQVVSQPCPGLVEEIEKGDFESAALNRLLAQYLVPLLAAEVDALILGCTHYPLVRQQIARIIGDNVQIIDSGAAVARRLRQQLDEHHLLSPVNGDASVQWWTSGDVVSAEEIIGRLWANEVKVQLLPV
ncbi:MAG: glutamate racemase [Gammaproteobacteria bacterium]|nr:glutamate racemase [Gammaproteobacteria bacterium]